MSKRDRSLSVRFLIWWFLCVVFLIGICGLLYYSIEKNQAAERLKEETFTFASVLAPRVTYDIETQVAGYAHQTLKQLRLREDLVGVAVFGSTGTMMFATEPVFRRVQETPGEVTQVLGDAKPRWVHVPSEDRYLAYYPLMGRAKAVGVLQVSRDGREVVLLPGMRTGIFVLICSVIAALASMILLWLMRRHYFKPLQELNGMLETVNKPIHAATALEIPESEFHGELASLYRHAAELSQNLAKARKAVEGRVDVQTTVEQMQEEARFLARQVYEHKIDKVDLQGGYQVLSKPIHLDHWGKVWKNTVARNDGVVYFSYWQNKNDGLKGVLQGAQWDEIFQGHVKDARGLEEISDELFMEFGLDMEQWLVGGWDPQAQTMELLGNAWAGRWDHAAESFSFLTDARPLAGTRKRGFWAKWSFVPGDKLVVLNLDASGAQSEIGWQDFLDLLSKNIKSTPSNLRDLLLQEHLEGRQWLPHHNLFLMVHSSGHAAAHARKTPIELPPSFFPRDVVAR